MTEATKCPTFYKVDPKIENFNIFFMEIRNILE